MSKQISGTLMWLVATLFVVYSFCLSTAAAVFSSTIKSTLNASDMGVSLATGAFILGFACMQIPAGYLLDKYNAKMVVSVAILILVLGNITISFSDTLLLFSLSNLVQGVGASFAFVAAGVLIAQWFSNKTFPILFGLTQTISCVATGILHYSFTIALANYSWNSIYRGLALFGLVLFILAVLFVKTPLDFDRGKNLSLMQALSRVFKNKQILLCSIAAATSFGILLAYGSFWYLRVQQYYSVENLEAVLISGMIFFGIGIGTPILALISNRVQSRIMVIHISLIIGTMALLLGLYLPHFNIETLIIVKVVSFLIGFFLSGSMLFYTMVSELSSDNTRGIALSVTNTAVYLFTTMMMFIPYFFVTAISTMFFTYLWILPFCIMFSILLLSFIKDTFATKLGE